MYLKFKNGENNFRIIYILEEKIGITKSKELIKKLNKEDYLKKLQMK